MLRSVMALMIVLFATGGVFSQQGGEYKETWDVLVRLGYDSNGDGTIDPLDPDEGKDYWAKIDLKRPGIGDQEGFGTVIKYTASNVNGQKTNCNGDRYEYYVVNIPDGWSGTVEKTFSVDGQDEQEVTVVVPINVDDVQRFYDFHYREYQKVTQELDFSENCHGYAFGVEDWPAECTEILAVGPFVFPSPKTPCWEIAEKADAEVAADVFVKHGTTFYGTGHSVKVTGEAQEAVLEGTLGLGPNGGPLTATVDAITETMEKFRASAIYRQTSNFPDNLNIGKATCGPSVFELFKKN